MEDMECEKTGDLFEKARVIFAEREKEFQLQKKSFDEQENSIKRLLQRILSEKDELKGKREEIEKEQIALKEEQDALYERSIALEQKEQALKEQQECVKGQEKELLVKYNLELEQVRNDELKLKRLTTEYEYKLSMMDSGMTKVLQDTAPALDLENYISIEEHNREVFIAKSKTQEFMKELDNKENVIREMKEERRKLLAKIVELRSSQAEEEDQIVIKQEEATVQEQAVRVPQNSEANDDVEEELKVNVLRTYLIKNRPDFEKLEIRHTEDGELLYGERRGLTYNFLFVEPPTFDISAERKNSSKLRKQLETYNQKFPEVQFHYDEAEQKVYATGYFTNQLKAYELMKRVQVVADCFRQEG